MVTDQVGQPGQVCRVKKGEGVRYYTGIDNPPPPTATTTTHYLFWHSHIQIINVSFQNFAQNFLGSGFHLGSVLSHLGQVEWTPFIACGGMLRSLTPALSINPRTVTHIWLLTPSYMYTP